MSGAELDAIRAVDLDWTKHLESIWTDDPADIPAVQERARQELLHRIEQLDDAATTASPLGSLLLGPAGAGKTHLLGVVRAATLQRGGTFVLVDLTTVRNFWETVLLGYFKSLVTPAAGPVRQHQLVLQHLLTSYAPPGTSTYDLGTATPEQFLGITNQVLSGLSRAHRDHTLEHQDVIRAFLLLESQDFELQNIGYSWLQGGNPIDDARVAHGLRAPAPSPESIVAGLSWVISLRGPTVIAFDQLDAVLAERHAAASGDESPAEANQAQALLLAVSGGLMALRDLTRRTLTVVSALRESWNTLMDTGVAAVEGRFQDPLLLPALQSGAVARDVVSARLREGYERAGFRPPYDSWPFRPEAFTGVEGGYVRQTLRMCDQHLTRCLRRDRVEELFSFDVRGREDTSSGLDDGALAALDEAFQRAHQGADLEPLHDPRDEHAQDAALHAVAGCLAVELFAGEPRSAGESEVVESGQYVQHDFSSNQSFEPLHVALRVPDAEHPERSWGLGMRFLQSANPIAFQARLRAAMTESGIELGREHRRCVLFRTQPTPSGGVTLELLAQFERLGGTFVRPSESELRVFAALASLVQVHGIDAPDLRRWLVVRRPASQLSCIQDTVAWLGSPIEAPPAPPPRAEAPAPEPAGHFVLGRRREGDQLREPVSIPVPSLAHHLAVVAGSGSGTTVLLKHLVEETVLQGIPCVVIDGAHELARLGDPWPAQASPLDATRRARAAMYLSQSDVRVYTPGRATGRPLMLATLPDLHALRDHDDEYAIAKALSRGSLADMLEVSGEAAQTKLALLGLALDQVAEAPGGGLPRLLQVLDDPPAALRDAYYNADSHLGALAAALRAQMQGNPRLAGAGTVTDPAELFGFDSDRTRVSVIDLGGLPGLGARQRFVDQLARTLFSWIKTHPGTTDTLRGLLVLDEAADFAPAGRSVACLHSLQRLATQARTYGLGMVFATQDPNGIDPRVVAQTGTQLFGKVSAPSAVRTVREHLRRRGADGREVPRLGTGTFFVCSEGAPPVLTKTPMCLSHHPSSPLHEAQVLERAQRGHEVV